MTDYPEGPLKVVDRRWWARAEGGAEGDAEGGDAPSTWEPEKPTYVQQLERQLAEKDAALQDVIVKYRDAQREFDEARARLRKDVQRDLERSRRTFLVDLLEIVDNLDRALDAAHASPDTVLRDGVEMVRRQFLAKLEGFGVSRVDALGTPFDPTRHEAVSTSPTSDPSQDGLVIGIVAPGYRIGDEVLRPAQVAVGRLTD